MHSQNAASVTTLDSPAWGVSLSRDELDATNGGIFPLVAWVVGALAVSVLIGMIDKAISGDCTCR